MVVVALGILAMAMWLATDDFEHSPTTSAAADANTPEAVDVLVGRVVDDVGRPIPDAVVHAGDEATTVDDGGQFSFPALVPGTHVLDARAEDHLRAGVDDDAAYEIVIAEDESTREVELVLPRAASVAGRVTEAGEPVDDATISLSYIHARGLDAEPVQPYIVSDVAHSDDEGRFTLSEVAPGRLQVLIETDDAFAESDEFQLEPGEHLDDVAVDLAPSGEIQVFVVGEDDQPLRAEVTLKPSYADDSSHTVTTGAEGLVSIDRLVEGYYDVTVDAQGHVIESVESLFVDGSGPTRLELSLQRSQGLVGRVIEPDGTPVANAAVTLESDAGVRRPVTGEEGRFQWRDAPTDVEWTVLVQSDRHDASPRMPITPGEEIAVELTPGGLLVGRVIDERRRPITEFSISPVLQEIRGEGHDHPRQMPTLEVDDPRGHFEVGPIPSGRYRLVVDAPDFAATTVDSVTVEAGENSGPMTIEVDRGASIAGTVTDATTGEPLPDTYITFDAAGGGLVSANTDEYGEYRLGPMPTGYHPIRFAHDDFVNEIRDGIFVPDSGVKEYDVELEPRTDDSPGQVRYDTGLILGPSDNGQPRVLQVLAGSTAHQAGVEAEDIVTAVDGTPVDDAPLDEVLTRIRGDAEVPVTLQIRRPGRGTMTFDVERKRVSRW